MKSWISKHPNVAFFTFTFAWTWAIVFALIFTGAVKDVSKPTPVFIISGLICGLSPSLSAILVAGICKGRQGIQELLGRFRWPGRGKWYAVALLTVPLATVLTTLCSALFLREYRFALTVPLLAMGVVWPFFSAFGEEFGWRGYVLPQLLQCMSPLKAGLLLGVVWELWHLPMHYIGYQAYGKYMLPAYLIVTASMVIHSVIMAQIFSRTGGTLKTMILYHWTITGSSILLGAFLQTDSLLRNTTLESAIGILFQLAAAAVVMLLAKNDARKHGVNGQLTANSH